MKKLSILFVSVLSIAAFTGCKKKGGDCAGTINGMMDREMADAMKAGGDKMSADDKKKGEEMMKAMSDTMIKVCTDDKWSAELLKCMDDAKTDAEGKKCDAMMTPEQKASMKKATGAMMGMEDKADKAMDKAADKMAGSGAAPAAGGGDLPAECNDYKAAMDKIASCDKMPKEARDQMKTAFDQASAGWANLPAEAKAGLASACKAGADGAKAAAAACN